MKNTKILETAGQELESRVSAASNMKQVIEGTKSSLLDTLILGENKTTRENFGNPIKEELEKKIQIARAQVPPKTEYIKNMEKIIIDLETRIQGQKTDDSRANLLDLDKDKGFNEKLLTSFVDDILQEAMKDKDIWRTKVYQKLTTKSEYITEILDQLNKRKNTLTNDIQKENIESIIKTFSKKGIKINEQAKSDSANTLLIAERSKKLSEVRNDENITISYQGKTITLKKINEYDRRPVNNAVIEFNDIIDASGNIRNEKLMEFLTNNIDKIDKEKTAPVKKADPEPVEPVGPTKAVKEVKDMDANDIKDVIVEEAKKLSWEGRATLLASLFVTAATSSGSKDILKTKEWGAFEALGDFLFKTQGGVSFKETQDEVRENVTNKIQRDFLEKISDEVKKEGVQKAIDVILEDLFTDKTATEAIKTYIETYKNNDKSKEYTKLLKEFLDKYAVIVVKKDEEKEAAEAMEKIANEFLELAKAKRVITATEVYESAVYKKMMKEEGSGYVEYINKLVAILETKKAGVDTDTKTNIDVIMKALVDVTNEGADTIHVFNPDDEKDKKEKKEDKEQKETYETIWDIENKDPNYLIALQNKIENMKNGDIIILSTKEGLIKLQKENEYGFKCIHNEVEGFKPFVESDGEYKNSRVSKENLYKFLNIKKKKVDPIPPRPDPIPPRPTPHTEVGEQEVTATLSNTYQVRYADAERKAGEELREKRAKTSRWNAPQKLNLFLRRKFIKENIISKEMKYTDFEKSGKLNRDKDTTAAADRHEIEEQEKFNEKIENVLGSLVGFEQNYPNTYKEIVKLVEKFTGSAADGWIGTINENGFQPEFEKILQRSSALDGARPATGATMPASGKGARRPLLKLLSTNEMYQISSNICEKINAFKGEKILIAGIENEITSAQMNFPRFAIDNNQMVALSNAVDGKVRPLIADYVHNYKIMPSFLKTLKINLDNPKAMQELVRYSALDCTLTKIKDQTMRLKLQILNKGEEAYDVQEKLNPLASFGRRLDNPFSVKNKVTLGSKKFGKYLERHPGMKKFMGIVRGGVKLGVMVAPGAITMGLGAPLLAYSSVYGGMAAIKTLFAKFSHYNKEHKLYQKTQANELQETRNERDRIANAVSGMGRWQGRFRGKNMKMRRQLKYYIKTTQDQLDDSAGLVKDIDVLLRKNGPLTTNERDNLIGLTTDALARLDYHKETGQNFLGSQSPLSIEKDYQELQKLVVTSGARLNTDTTQLRTEPNYTTIKTILQKGIGNQENYNNQGYERARKRFKARERQQAAIGATKAGVVAFGISYGMGLLTGRGAKEAHDTANDVFKSEYALGQHTDNAFASGNLKTDLTNFLNHTNGLGTEDKLRVVLTGSTDATHVAAHSMLNNPNLLITQKAEIIKHISGLVQSGQLAPAYGTTINGWLNANASNLPTMFPGHENEILASLRTLNGARDLADALAKTTNPLRHTGTIPLDINAVGTQASKTVLNQADRFTALAIQTQNNTFTAANTGYGVGIGWDNTFAMNNMGEKHTDEDVRRYRSGREDETRFNRGQ